LTEAELDARYDAIVAQHPTGLTPAQWRRIALESADEDGRIWPHPVGDWWDRQRLMLKLFFDGYVEWTGGKTAIGYHRITEKGRNYVAKLDRTGAGI
jgi:hypothetical protein